MDVIPPYNNTKEEFKMASGIIEKNGWIAIPQISKNYAGSTSFFYTGISLEVPANSEFKLHFWARYVNGQPYEIAIGRNGTSRWDWCYHGSGGECFLTGYTGNSSSIFYFMARYENANGQYGLGEGYYRPIK